MKVLSNQANAAVVQLSGRSLPGVVLQGDTSANVIALLSSGTEEEKTEALQILCGVQSNYEAVCTREGIALPY